MSTGIHRCLKMPMCPKVCGHVCPYVSIDIQRCLLVSMVSIGSHKCLLVSIGV